MVAVKLKNFGGMIPAEDDHLIPQNQAALAENVWLYSGSMEGFRDPAAIYTLLNSNTRKVFRIPKTYYDKDHIPDSYWLEFQDADVDVIRSPVIEDAFSRYYWVGDSTAPTGPKYNTLARIIAASAPYILGIPAPSVAPGVSQPSTGTGVLESRAYVYTWVSAYGEEGPPSPATVLNGWDGDPWDITLTAPGPSDTADRDLAKVRIYRTVTATGGPTTYFLVDELDIATLAYTDIITDDVVTGNALLPSTYWTAPPSDLVGWVQMPNGIIAGWRGNEVWFSEPYRPHAWPVSYVVNVEYPIVGMGVIGQTLIVCTTAEPHAISGVSPATMAVSKLAAVQPCMSRDSVVSTPAGVFYASPDGIVLAQPGAAQVVTRGMISKDKWLDPTEFLYLRTVRAAVLNGGYYAWGSVEAGCFDADCFDNSSFEQNDYTGAYSGLFIDFDAQKIYDGSIPGLATQRVSFTKLASVYPIENIFTDHWTGEVFLIKNGQVYWQDLSVTRQHLDYVWRSKIFETPNKRNLEALRVYFTVLPDNPSLSSVTFPLSVWDDTQVWNDDDVWSDSVDPTTGLTPQQWGIIRMYADGVLKFSRELKTPGEFMRLPSGFKATYWQFEVAARVRIDSIEFATAAKELGTV